METQDGELTLHVDHSRDGVGPMVHVRGEIDSRRRRRRACLLGLEGDVIVDLSEVAFLDSTGLGILVAQRKRLGVDGGSLILRSANPMVARTVELVGLGDWLDEERDTQTCSRAQLTSVEQRGGPQRVVHP